MPISADASRHVTQLVDGGALATIAGLVVIAAAVAHRLRNRFGGSTLAAWISLASLAPILAVTLLRQEGFGFFEFGWSTTEWSWWLHGWDRLAASSIGDSEFVLNIVLFTGAGAAWYWCTRRGAWAVTGWLCAFSFIVESLQAVLGRGAPDVRDWVANTIGAAIGVAFALLVEGVVGHRMQRPGDAAGSARWATRKWVIAAAVVAAVAGLGIGGRQLGASHEQSSLLAELHAAFDDTTKADMATYFVDGNHRLGEFNAKVSVISNDWRWSDDAPTFEARYPVDYFGVARCIFVTWTATDVNFRKSSGPNCTAFHG